MKQEFFDLSIETPGKSLTDISGKVQCAVSEHEFVSGLLTLWCVHTGAALLVQANADPEVLKDIETFFEKLVPKSQASITIARPRKTMLHRICERC